MPHLIFEYTANLEGEADLPGLLAKANGVLIAQGGVFPTGGIRARAVRLEHYCIADGATASDAFVHATLKIGAGRSEAQKAKVCADLFAMMKAHFAPSLAVRGLALSLELVEFPEAGTFKHNTIHARFNKG